MPEEADTTAEDEWFKEHFLELVERYPGSWIAVSEGKVIADGTTRRSVTSAATRTAAGHAFSVYLIEPTALMY